MRIANILLLLAFFIPTVASAHAFGQQYTLPLPFSLYAFGATAALIASFVFLSLYSDPTSVGTSYAGRRITISTKILARISSFVGIAAFVAVLAIAFLGSDTYLTNPVPVIFWTIFLLGMTYLSVLIGGLWRFFNPFEHITRFFFSHAQPLVQFPEKFRYIPVVILFFLLVWIELLSNGAGGVPSFIGMFLIVYLFMAGCGAFIFGVDEWFQYGDVFNVFFGVIGEFAPIQIGPDGVELVLPAERLVEKSVSNISLLTFILLMLSSTVFDGLQETQVWWSIMYHFPIQINLYTLERTIILGFSPLIFLALYSVAISLMEVLARSQKNFTTLALRFGYSLVPIAIAYNFAHYFTIFLNEGQVFIGQISDPFARGWNLFGTVGHTANIALMSAKTVWYTQLGVIVVGHIVATYVAHRIALREFDSRDQIIFGQIPVLLLMVCYTVFGLWILSQGYKNG